MTEIYTIIEKDYTGFITLNSFYTFDAACRWCANKVWDEWGHDDDEETVK